MRRETRTVLVDLAVIAVVTALALVAAIWLDLFEHVVEWIALHESFQIDELIAPMVLLPFALAVFSLRRWRDLRQALAAREQAEQQVAKAARLEGVLLAARTMQHEINNQLGVTVGYSEMLATDARLSSEQREMANAALLGAEQAAAHLDRLRLLTRLEVQHVGAPDGPVLGLAARPNRSGEAPDR